MVSSKEVTERRRAAGALGSAFSLLPDKDEGWQDLHRLNQDQDSFVRWFAAETLGSVFSFLPDKMQGWQDLHQLNQDKDNLVRCISARSLGIAFIHLSDKTNGWQDLCRLTRDEDCLVREVATYTLGAIFSYLPDKSRGWEILHRLTYDNDRDVRRAAALALGSAFAHLPDKMQGWQDLNLLAHDEDHFVGWGAALVFGRAFVYIADKERGWHDIRRLAYDQDSFVRQIGAESLGLAFAHLPDKMQGWQDLVQLSQDTESEVRMHAYHSLGRVSVFKAIDACDMDSVKNELESGVEYFKKSTQENSYFNPASFCYFFYRSYIALTFQRASHKEVKIYLTKARNANDDSESKMDLISAVDSLSRALEEAKNLKEKTVEHIHSDLQAYQWYLDRAAEHMAAAEHGAPGAVGLLRKCNPIIEERIEATIAGIQKAAREICQVTRGSGTKYEAPGAEMNREARSLSSENPINAFKSSTRIATILREFCELLPKDKRGHACEIVDEIDAEQQLSGRLSKIELALTYLQPNICLQAIESVTMDKLELMDKKLNTIIFDLSKIKISSGNISLNLHSVRAALVKIAETEKSSAADHRGFLAPLENPSESQIALGNLIEAKVSELEEILNTKSTKDDVQGVLMELESLKPSAGFEWLGRIADVIAVFDASIKVFEFLM